MKKGLTAAERRADALGVLVERIDRKKLFKKHKGKCGICERKLNPRRWTLDHVIPLSKGGTHEYKNVQPAHEYCNRLKADKMPGEVVQIMQVKRRKGKQRYYNPAIKKPLRAVA